MEYAAGVVRSISTENAPQNIISISGYIHKEPTFNTQCYFRRSEQFLTLTSPNNSFAGKADKKG